MKRIQHLLPHPYVSAIVIICLLCLQSCRQTNRQEENKPETPKALQEEHYSSEVVYKRGADDLVQSLYDDEVEKNPELKTLENNITELKNSREDSTRQFGFYNEKNIQYFNSAQEHASQIKDSILKLKIESLLDSSLAKYNLSVEKHQRLLKNIDTKNLELDDLHSALTILTTLSVMTKYQIQNLPNTNSLNGYIKQMDEVIKEINKVAKK